MFECPRAGRTFVGRLRDGVGVGDIISYGLVGVQEPTKLLIPLYEPTMNLFCRVSQALGFLTYESSDGPGISPRTSYRPRTPRAGLRWPGS